MRRVVELPETFESIARPVSYDVIRKVGELMHLPSVTEILLAGPMEQAPQAGSVLNYKGAPSKFPGATRISVNMTEGVDEYNALAEDSFQENAPTVFLDKGLAVRLRPIYASTIMTLSFNVRSRTRVEAEKVRDEFRMRAAMGRRQILHELTYHYGIPEVQMEILKDIYALREKVAGYGDTFEVWLKTHASNRLTQISNLIGKGEAWVFGEQQVAVQGTFDFMVQPEAPEKADDAGEYNYPFQYHVRYDKAVGMSLDYPLVVHNQLIPSKWYGPYHASGHTPDPYQGKLYSDRTGDVFRELFLNRSLKPKPPIDGIRYPLFDDWLPNQVTPHTSTCYVTMLQADPEDLHDIVDLTDLSGVVIDGDILQYMASQGSKLGKHQQCAVHVGLYKNQTWMGDDAITVSPDLKVRSVEPLCLRDRYHLRIAVVNDLMLLADDARFALRLQGAACIKILLTLQGNLPYGDYVPKLKGNGIVPDRVLLDSAKRINQFKKPHQNGLECRMLTVGNFFVVAERLNSYAPNETGSTLPDAPVEPTRNPDLEQAVSGSGEQSGDNAC